MNWGVGMWFSGNFACDIAISTYNVPHACPRCQVTDNVVYLVLTGEDRILRFTFSALTYLVGFIFVGPLRGT